MQSVAERQVQPTYNMNGSYVKQGVDFFMTSFLVETSYMQYK